MAGTYDTQTSLFIKEVVAAFYGEELLKGVEVNKAIVETAGQVLYAATAGRVGGSGLFSWVPSWIPLFGRKPGYNDWPDRLYNGEGWGETWILDARVSSYWYRTGRHKLTGPLDSMARATAARNFKSEMALAAGKSQDSELDRYLGY